MIRESLQLTPESALATIQQDIFKPTKFGGKYTVTLIPGQPSADNKDEHFN